MTMKRRMLMMSCLFQDNVIFERLTDASQYKELTIAHLEQFATEGMAFLFVLYFHIYIITA